MIPIRITIPGDPKAKGRPRFTRNGIAYQDKKTANWESQARLFASQAMSGDPIDDPVQVVIHAYFAIPTSWTKWKKEQAELENVWHTIKPDADNVAKSTLDAINQIVIHDDKQVCGLQCFKRYSVNPRVEITVTPMRAIHSHSKRDRVYPERKNNYDVVA